MANQDFNAARRYAVNPNAKSAFGEGIYEKVVRLEKENRQLKEQQANMTEHDATIQDLQKALDEVRQERDSWRELTYSFAKYQATEEGVTVFEVIENEKHWLQRQASWNTVEDIK